MTIQAPLHPGSWLLGSTREALHNQVEFFTHMFANGQRVTRFEVGLPVGRRTFFAAATPEAAERILSAKSYANFRKDIDFYEELRTVLGNGILTAQDDDWLRQKRFVQPIFTRARVDGYLDMILAEVRNTAEAWRRDPGQQDLGLSMAHLTLQVVGRVLFGGDVAALEAAVRANLGTLNEGLLARVVSPVKVPLEFPLPLNRRIRAAQAALYDVCDTVIAARREGGESDDLAGLLVAARDGEDRLSDQEVRDQILIFLLAGHETTSTSLTFALHLLGRHPDIQQRVREEVATVTGGAPPTAAQVHGGLPWTTAVLKEAMRLYPAAPFTGRRVVEDTELHGFPIPAGSNVALAIHTIHRRPELWPEPLRFDPTRFLPEQEKGRHRYAWLPFGAGPRACIGQHFSMLESVAALAVLVTGFEFTAPPDTSDHLRVDSGVTLFPLDPVRSLVTPR